MERTDDFAERRRHLQNMSADQLHNYFWNLVAKIVDPLIEEAKTHTTPSIERSVLLRMGFSSVEAKSLVERFAKKQLLGHGAGNLILQLANAKSLPVREAGLALLDDEKLNDEYWGFFQK